MKLANTSFIHTSLNHRIVTRSPNHMCEVSCAIRPARPSIWFSVADSSSSMRRGVVEDRAGMLHAAELERRNEHEVELAERVGNAGVLLEPGERRGVQVENRVAVARDFGGVGLAMEHAELAAVALGRFDLELAGGEGEEIGRDRLRFGERDP